MNFCCHRTAPKSPALPDTAHYTIRLAENIAPEWGAWLGEMEVCHTPEGHSILTGPITDQAALHGLLAKIRDLHLTLLALKREEVAGGQWSVVSKENPNGDKASLRPSPLTTDH